MHSTGRRSVKVLLLIIIVGVLGTTLGVVGIIPARAGKGWNYSLGDGTVLGSGSAGSGSLAVAYFFLVSRLNGAGAFSGNVGGVPTSGLFSLTVSDPSGTPILPCPTGEVSAGGSVTSGSFLGEKVLVASCVGSGVPGAFVLYHVCIVSGCPDPDFSGSGTSTATVSSNPITAVFAAAGVTSGSGTAGTGTVYTAEVDASFAPKNDLFAGGAFVGTISDHMQGNTWVINKASVQPGCTFSTSGKSSSFGSFPDQPVSSSYTLTTCPPTSSGPQTARFVYAIGGDLNPMYKGTGSAETAIVLLS